MTALTEGKHYGEFVGELAMGIGFHVDAVTVKSGQNLGACAVFAELQLGTPTATAGAPVSAGGGTVGNGAVSAVSADAGAMAGTWLAEIVGAAGATAAFKVIRPDGTIDGQGNVGTAYNGSGSINFTIADGSTDYGPNMFVPISVVYDGDDSTKKVVEWDPAATDDARFVAGILMSATDASAADVVSTGLKRGPAVVNVNDLAWKTGLSAAEKALGVRQLLALGIKAA